MSKDTQPYFFNINSNEIDRGKIMFTLSSKGQYVEC